MSRVSSGDVPKAGQTIGKYTIVVELGGRMPATFAAHAAAISGEAELVVLESTPASPAPSPILEAFVRRARRLAQTRHPNVARLRDVVVSRDRIVLVSDFVEGETLASVLELDAASDVKRIGLPERLRVLVDVLSGMSGIHLAPTLVGDAAKNDPPLFHGAIHPKNILVGADGSSRLVRVARAPQLGSGDRAGIVEDPRYAAPELLLGDATANGGVDIYAVGVLLWEALSGAPLFTEQGEKEVVARQLAGPLPRATPPKDAEWATALIDVAARALEVDPEKRFSSTAELAGALRLAVQARLAPPARVGAAVSALANTKITERRARLRPTTRAAAAPVAKVESKAAAPTNLAAAALPTKTAPALAPKPIPKKAAPPPTAIANPPKITAQKTIVGIPRLASEPDDAELGPETKRLRVESIDDADLKSTDDEAVDSKWSNPPPAKKPSIAPPLPTRAIASMAPPLPTAAKPSPALPTPPPARAIEQVTAPAPEHVIEPLPEPEPVHFVAAAPPAPSSEPVSPVVPPAPLFAAPTSTENLETIAPVVSPMLATPATSAPYGQREDTSSAVMLTPEDPQRRRRVVVVLAMVAFAALILLVAGIKHLASGPSDSPMKTATTASHADSTATSVLRDPQPTASATTATTSAPIATAPIATTEPAQPEPTHADPISAAAPVTTTPSIAPHDATTHAAGPATKPTHKKPPHSSYEPEGI